MTARYQTDVVIAGAGLAGIVAAYELLNSGRRVLLIDKDKPDNVGGLARQSSGGIFLIDTPHQGRSGFRDSVELAWSDWQRVARYGPDDWWPQQWGEFFCERSRADVFDFVRSKGIKFLPVVNWAERGVYEPGNTVPRWHLVWGLGRELIRRLVQALNAHPGRGNLEIFFETEVFEIELTNGRASGLQARRLDEPQDFRIEAEQVVIASGGICGGDLSQVKQHWHPPWGRAPETLLNGAHVYADGMLHDRVAELGGALTHLDLHWHYPSGVHHPAKRRPNDGLSLVPPRSALWFNALGARILSPGPLAANGDTRMLVESVLAQPGQYSWQVLNWKIAVRELLASGSEYMTALREKSWAGLGANLLFGHRSDVRRLIRDCADDIVVADSLDQLMAEMNRRNLYGLELNRRQMAETIRLWDDMIERGPAFHNDEQLRRIASARAYRGDRVRTCNFQKILDPKAYPLIAIREFVLTRKSLGGIQTDLDCRVLRAADGQAIPGLYAIGEAAGFGGGGVHGKGSLEGTFLAGCILTGRVVGRSIARASALSALASPPIGAVVTS